MTTPQAQTPSVDDRTRPLSVKEWLLTIIILIIPFVNLIFFLYWSLASGVNVNRQNFCRAYILLFIISIGIAIILFILMLVLGLLGDPFDAAKLNRFDGSI